MNNTGAQLNPLLNKSLGLDITMMMNIIIELLNCKPLSCMHLPDFRIEQLIKYVTKRISPVNEKKVLEPICALYCLCMYFGMASNYTKNYAFRLFSLLQTLQVEAIVTLSNVTNKKVQMPDIFLALQKDETIDTNYKLEVFTDALAVAKLICRELYSMMKIVYRVGRRGALSATFTPDEKKKQAKYSECVQPYSVYFMCTFAYSHMAVVMHTARNLNIYPGTLESFVLMAMSTSPEVCAAMQEKVRAVATSSDPVAIIQAVVEQEATKVAAAAAAKEGAQQVAETESTKPAVAVVALKLGYEVVMEKAHKLALFVAHVIFDDRNLQEVRLAQGRLSRHFEHPNIVFAQFRTSAVKALLAQDHHHSSSSYSSQVYQAAAGSSTTTTTRVTSPKKDRKSPADLLAKVPANCHAILDIHQEGFHFLRRASPPEDWQLHDPSEQDFDYAAGCTSTAGKGRRGSSSSAKFSNQLTAEKLATAGNAMPVLPALQLGGRNVPSSARGRRDATPTNVSGTGRSSGRGGASPIKRERAVMESVGALPLPSSRISDNNNSNNLRLPSQRSARSGGQRSARSRSSDGEGGTGTGASDSESGSNTFDEVPKLAYTTKAGGNFSGSRMQMQSNKYSKQPKSGSAEDLFLSMDQKIAGYWATSKLFRPTYLVLDSLQTFPEFAHYFPEEYKPEPVEIAADQDLTQMQPPLNARVVHEACKIIESQYFHLSASFRLPRILDPTQDAYWICTYLLDYLARQTTNGQGLHPSTAMELNVLKKRFKSMKLENAPAPQDSSGSPLKVARVTRADLVALSSTSTTIGAATLRLPDIASPNKAQSTANSAIIAKQSRNKTFVSIQDRLAAAAVEASVESKLFSMERKLKAEFLPPPMDGEGSGSPTRTRFFSDFSEADQPSPDNGGQLSMHHHNYHHKDVPTSAAATPSVVWTCPPRQNYLRTTMFTGHDDDELNDNPFNDRISKQISVEYAKKILAAKKEKEEEEAQFQQYLADQQEGVIARNRAAKAEMIRQLREQTKAELLNKAKFKAEWEVLQRKQAQMDKARAKQEAKEREDKKLMEVIRIKDIKARHESRLRQEEIEHKEALKLEAVKIQMMASEAEVELINRMNREEARMKYLEERRRAVEDKGVQAEAARKARLARKQEKTADVRDHFQARIRMGNFKYHNGEFGFYDSVRHAPVEWVQYEDVQGVPYYYDPVTKLSQYRMPVDANIHHYTEDERREYDAIHGEGAYDAYKEDCAFKDGVNRDGGYYNEKGVWIVMDGYFDENYEWVPNEGYFDENGNYRKYAKICGDLSFMV